MIQANLKEVEQNILTACNKCGRSRDEITLIAVSKTKPVSMLEDAYSAGIRNFGENKVQELTAKLADNAYEGAPVHFIGHLQTNKVRQVVGKVDLIQSVDRLKLLDAIQAEAAKQGIRQDILLEINIGGEESKSGFSPEELPQVLANMGSYPNVFVRGLMTIPPICQNPGDNDKFFQKMFHLSVDISTKKYDNVSVKILSMGMSDDYTDAIRCGATMIRVGTAIFGARDYTKQHP